MSTKTTNPQEHDMSTATDIATAHEPLDIDAAALAAGAEVDQDWSAESTTYTFADGSSIVCSGMSVEVVPTRDEAIARAVRYLGAKQHGSPDDEEWRYYAQSTRSAWVHPGDDLEALGRRLIAGETDAYSRWCADPSTDGRELDS